MNACGVAVAYRRVPKPRTAAELAFLSLGPGANAWLVEAAAAGVRRIRAKMAEAVDLSKLHSPDAVDRALGTAAMTARFSDCDLISILDYQAAHEHAEPVRRSENHTLQPGTAAWSTFGQRSAPAIPTPTDDESDNA